MEWMMISSQELPKKSPLIFKEQGPERKNRVTVTTVSGDKLLSKLYIINFLLMLKKRNKLSGTNMMV